MLAVHKECARVVYGLVPIRDQEFCFRCSRVKGLEAGAAVEDTEEKSR